MSNEMSNPPGGGRLVQLRIEVTGGFLVLLALGGFCLGGRTVAALGLGAAAHELGHLAALLGQNRLPRVLRLDSGGLCIHYDGGEGRYSGLLCRAAAGPAAGLLLSAALWRAGAPFLRETAALSLALSLVNLLPASPLDGGQALRALNAMVLGLRAADRCALALDCLCLALTLALGLCFQPLLLPYGAWLLVRILRRD